MTKDLRERVGLRAEGPGDVEFLWQVYASTRAEEMAISGWDEGQVKIFLDMQFKAQYDYYRHVFPAASFEIILLDGSPVGRFYVARQDDHILLIDLVLLPDFRGQGIGTMILKDLAARAFQENLPLRLHLEYNNRSRSLCERLGFRLLKDEMLYLFFERLPEKPGWLP